jgi:RecB family exonuclease
MSAGHARIEAVHQLGFEGMPQRLYTCTPTRLGTWLDCPRRYRMTYLDRPPPGKGPPWAHNSLGASVHNALAGWWRLPRAERTAAACGDLLEQGWIEEGFADSAQSARYRCWARRLVESYAAGLDPACEPIGVERTVATRTDLIAVSGRIDRLDERRGADGSSELVVVDYKTGRHLLTVDDTRTSLPLALYALAAERVMRRPCRRVELHHLPTGRVLAWEHTAESLARHLRRAEAIAAECAAADERYRGGEPATSAPAGGSAPALPARLVDEVFPPRPGPSCGWCDYRAHCPEGSAASDPRRPWDGLSDNALESGPTVAVDGTPA